MKFTYKARTKEGKIETGTIEAYSKEDAALLLQKDNIFVTSLNEQKTKESFFERITLERRVAKKELAVFFRQLSVMLESGVPVVQSLLSIAAQIDKTNFKKTILKISNLVEQGIPLSEAFAAYPKIFNSFYVSLVKSGEASGKISATLSYISDNLEREYDIASQVRQAMVYPTLVICGVFVVIGIIILQVVPRILDLIKASNVQPSLFTIVTLNFYTFIENYWWIIIILSLLLVSSLVYYSKTKKGMIHFDALSLKTPFLKIVLKKVFLARFCNNVSTLLVAGISINRALQITEDTINNVVYKEIIVGIGKAVSEGEKMSSAMLRNQDYFPPFVIQMIKVGEETGKLDKALMTVVNFYQKEIKRTIDLFSTLLEPIVIVFLGIIVGFLALSVLYPIYESIGNI